MALPTVQKTWQFDINQALVTAGADIDSQQLLFMIKESMIGFASGHWTVTSSSDGTVPNTGLGDNWGAYGDLLFGSGVNLHAWIVLTNSATGAQFCIDCNVVFTAAEACPTFFSPGGGYSVVGLVPTARPTPPADEIVRAGSGFGGTGNDGSFGRIHVMMSDDGECTRVLVCKFNVTSGLWIIDAAKSPIPGWTDPHVFAVYGENSNLEMCLYSKFNDAANVRGFITTSFSMFMTAYGYLSAMVGEQQTMESRPGNEFTMSPIGLASVTAAHQGRKGALYDLWWGPTGTPPSQTYPLDGSYQYAQFGNLIFPWNGTLPRLD